MKRRSRLALVGLLLVAGIVGAVVLAMRAPREAAPSAAEPPAAARVAPHVIDLDEQLAADEGRRAAMPAPGGELSLATRVVDEGGSAVEGATVKLASESLLALSPLVKTDCDCGCGELLVQCTCARAKKRLPQLVKRAHSEPPEQLAGVTGHEGRHVFEGLRRDRYRVWARAPGMAVASHAGVRVVPGGLADLELVLRPGIAFAGEVRSTGGNAVRGAVVVALSEVEVGGMARTHTDERGHFAFAGLAEAPYYVYATARGYAAGKAEEVGDGDELVIELAAGAVIGGTVRDDRGEVAGARVHVVGSEGEGLETRGDGRFEVGGLGAGTYFVWAEHGIRTSDEITEVALATGEVRTDVDLRLVTAGTVRGKVIEAGSGEGLGGAKVGAARTHTGTVREGFTETDGSFVLRDVPPGAFVVTAEAEDHRPGEGASVSLVAGGEVDVEIVLGRAGALEGIVRGSDGAVLAGAKVVPSSNPRHGVTTDGGGFFHLEGLEPVESVSVSHPDHVARTVEGVEVDPEVVKRIEVELQAGARIRGRVIGPDGEPAAGIDVGIADEGFGPDRPWWSGPSARSGKDGAFELVGLEAGTVHVGAKGKRFLPVSVGPFEVGAGIPVDGVVISLAEGESITARVVDGEGDPVRKGRVAAKEPATGTWVAWARLDAAGHVRLEGLRAGVYDLDVRADGFQPLGRAAVRTGARDLELVVRRAGALEGIVVAAETGEPVTSFSIGGESFRSPDGSFVFEGLQEEAKRVAVQSEGRAPAWIGPFAGSSGDVVDAGTIVLARGAGVRGAVLRADGTPVVGARVGASFQQEGDGVESLGWASAGGGTTGADGVFEITGLGPGSWYVHTQVDDEWLNELVMVPDGVGMIEDVVLRAAGAAEQRAQEVLAEAAERVGASMTPAEAESMTVADWYEGLIDELTDEERTPAVEALLDRYRAAIETP